MFRLQDTVLLELVFDVPKITKDSSSSVWWIAIIVFPQLAEQLVEVPTVVSHSSLQQQFAEQNVVIPVPSARLRQIFKVSTLDRVRQRLQFVDFHESLVTGYFFNACLDSGYMFFVS